MASLLWGGTILVKRFFYIRFPRPPLLMGTLNDTGGKNEKIKREQANDVQGAPIAMPFSKHVLTSLP
jgi:hypothetical protein